MKTLMTTNSAWAATAKPDIQKTLGATVISGTCVVAHDAATWMMSIYVVALIAFVDLATVAALPFFLFTLPAGALAR